MCPLHKDMPDTCPVPGVGPIDAKIMLVGEALGEDESLLEKPFVGRCGKFLDEMLKKAGLVRSELYITNVVKCRPTKNNGKSNRPPSKSEINICKGWLWRELQLVKPEIVVTLGRVPTGTLLSGQLKNLFTLGKIIGVPHIVDYMDATIIPLFHPSYLVIHGRKHIEQCVEVLKGLV